MSEKTIILAVIEWGRNLNWVGTSAFVTLKDFEKLKKKLKKEQEEN